MKKSALEPRQDPHRNEDLQPRLLLRRSRGKRRAGRAEQEHHRRAYPRLLAAGQPPHGRPDEARAAHREQHQGVRHLHDDGRGAEVLRYLRGQGEEAGGGERHRERRERRDHDDHALAPEREREVRRWYRARPP